MHLIDAFFEDNIIISENNIYVNKTKILKVWRDICLMPFYINID
jgi:hypothetical protein